MARILLGIMIGKKLLHYEIVEKLGAGGMGEVYRGRDTKLGRDVAIKVLPESMYRDPERRRRFEREARVVAALNHPNIVTIYSVEEVDDRPFLTMELVKGRTLRDVIGEEGVSLGAFFQIAVPLVEAMCSAHAGGITHRDLKPANVMLNAEGRVKVLDFGLAKLIQETAADENRTVGIGDTVEGQILGTVSYMSPEQVEGKPLDARSDIFSLGIIFYEMLTGRRPFAGDSHASTISAILRDTPPLVTELRETLPTHLGRIVRRCLAKEPDRRYQSPVDLRNDLQELSAEVDTGSMADHQSGMSVMSAGPASSLSSSPSPSLSPSLSSVSKPSTPSDSIVLPGSKRTYGLALAVIALVAIAAIVFVVSRMRSPESSSSATVASIPRSGMTLGVIGFENLGDPEDSENLGRVLTGLVTTGLAESAGLNVASTAKILAAHRQVNPDAHTFDASQASAVARNAGAGVMLVGQVIHSGERLILTAELVDVESGNAIGSLKKEAASTAELFELAGAIAMQVRELMGIVPTGTPSDEIDLAETLTNSPDAYRQFAAGEVAVHQGRYDQAVELFTQAIRIDSTFALAYLRLNLAYTWNGETEKGLQMAKRGLPHIGRLPARWQIVYAASIDFYEGAVEAAHDKLTLLIEASPNIPDAYNLLGEIATHYSQFRDVRRARDYFERALEIDPTFEVVFFHLIDDYIQFNDLRAIEKLIEQYRRGNPGDRRVADAEITLLQSQQKFTEMLARVEDRVREGDLTRWAQQAFALAATGDWDGAFAVSQQALERGEKGYNKAFAFRERGDAQIGRGNVRAGLADLDTACAVIVGMGRAGRWAASIVGGYRQVQAEVLLATGDFEAAIVAARRGIEEDPRYVPVYRALLSAQLASGKLSDAESTIRDLQRVRDANQSPGDGFQLLLAEAELEKARGNLDNARNAMRRAEALPIETRIPHVQWVIDGDIQAAAGDVDAAILSYRKVLYSTEFLLTSDVPIPIVRIPVYYKLAHLEDQLGLLADAREHYRNYLKCWGNADKNIAHVEEARTRLQALEKM